MPNATRRQHPKRLEEVRTVLRRHHDSMHTERSSGEWIVRFVRCHGLRSRPDLFPATPQIEAFLTDLAVPSHVAPATPNQAMHALVLLDTRVLNHALEGRIHVVRAAQKRHVPVVMTRAAVISLLDGTAQLVANLLYGSGVRLLETVRLRIKDIDGPMKPLTVRSGQGDKDWCPTVPATLTPLLQNHLAGVKTWHQQESAQGHGAVSLPHALARKSPPAAKAWGWPSVFPARNLSVDPRSGITRRHHGAPSVTTKAIKVAVRRAGLTKPISAQTFRHAVATHRLPRGTDIRTMQPWLGHHDVATTMISTHILQQGGQGVPSPLDDLGV
jgi:integron integrase